MFVERRRTDQMSPSGLKAKQTAFGSRGNRQVEAAESVCSWSGSPAMTPRAKVTVRKAVI